MISQMIIEKAFNNEFNLKYREDLSSNSIIVTEKQGKSRGRMYWFEDDPTSMYFEGIYVEKHERRNRLGSVLLQTLEQLATILGAETCYLWVDKTAWMHAWYQRKGYVDYIDHDVDNHIWMSKTIKKLDSNDKQTERTDYLFI